MRDFIENRQLVHRLGAMDDTVNITVFLCGGQAGFITGETLRVAAGNPLSI